VIVESRRAAGSSSMASAVVTAALTSPALAFACLACAASSTAPRYATGSRGRREQIRRSSFRRRYPADYTSERLRQNPDASACGCIRTWTPPELNDVSRRLSTTNAARAGGSGPRSNAKQTHFRSTWSSGRSVRAAGRSATTKYTAIDVGTLGTPRLPAHGRKVAIRNVSTNGNTTTTTRSTPWRLSAHEHHMSA